MTGRARALALVALACLNGPRPAAAEATFVVQSADGPGEGFLDATPVTPVGGNTGTTVGAQRLIAVQHAANLWGTVLDSDVPIVVSATFDAFACTGSATTLATASAAGLLQGIDEEGADPSLGYPDALANRLLGADFAPDEPEIVATFNSAVDAGCLPGTKWYYGLDAAHGVDHDLVNVALHELAHGLGIQAFVDAGTGQQLLGFPSVYSSHVLDLDAAARWSDLNDAQRAASYANARRVVWDGLTTATEASSHLLSGRPEIQVSPSVAGFTGLASDASFGAPQSASGPLVTSISGCPSVGVTGAVVLLRDSCATSTRAAMAAASGAVGVLLDTSSLWTSPPAPADEDDPDQVDIPVLALSIEDADRLEDADELGTVNVSLSFAAGLRGADAQGRVLLNATQPAATGSSISHWDELARPDLLMEAIQKPRPTHDLDLTAAMLADLGWVPLCGNGRLDEAEACDDGDDNSDSTPDACRIDCTLPSCGDGVRDADEGCDDGDDDNSDSTPDACRVDCTLPSCGDDVRDDGEECDHGGDNSDDAPDACRTDCTLPSCGDDVRDDGEECDHGGDNNDSTPDACRVDCMLPSCGDDVRDDGEGCDDGDDNSDSTPDACRTDCSQPRCGDGVQDDGEECDHGDDNSDDAPDACRTDCRVAVCGDGVHDTAEACDDGAGNSDSTPDACRSNCMRAYCGDRVRDRAERCDVAASLDCVTDCPGQGTDAGAPIVDEPEPPDAGDLPDAPPSADGCGCRVAARSTRLPALGWWLGACAAWLGCRRRSIPARRSNAARSASVEQR